MPDNDLVRGLGSSVAETASTGLTIRVGAILVAASDRLWRLAESRSDKQLIFVGIWVPDAAERR